MTNSMKSLKNTTTNQHKHITSSFSMPEDLFRSLELFCGRAMRSKSSVIQESLKKYLLENMPKGK